MKIIRPFLISDGALVSTTVPATDPSSSGSYNPATSYLLGQIVQVDSPTFTFTASGMIMTSAAHGWGMNKIVRLSSTGTLPTPLIAGKDYYLVQITVDTVRFSASKGGAPIITTSAGTGIHTATVSSHKLYESLVSSNIGNTPHKNPDLWLELGATNRWKCIDDSNTTLTQQADSIQYVFQTIGRLDSVALMNVSASEVKIMAKSAGVIVYPEKTYNMSSSAVSVTDWYTYFFEPIYRKTALVDSDFPAYSDMEVTITLNDLNNTVQVGEIIIGASKTIGATQHGASVGITDYSIKSADEFGNYTLTQRTFSKRGSFQLHMPKISVDSVQKMLETYRAIPCVYVGSELYDATIIYGFYKDFNINIAYQDYSTCTIDVEGLT